MGEVNWGELILGGVIGTVFGILGSFGYWWFFTHFIVPQVKFSQWVSKIPNLYDRRSNSEWRYRIKFGNFGKRDIIDLEVKARLVIKGLAEDPNISTIVYLPLENEWGYRIGVLRPWIPDPKVARTQVLVLGIHLVEDFFTDHIFPEPFRELAELRKLTLEDLLSLGNSASIQIQVFGYDRFSGARTLSESILYTIDSIKEGQFSRIGNVLEIPSAQTA